MRRNKLFTLLPDGVGMEVRIEFRVSKFEREKIKNLAAVRHISVSDFLRRAALGRAAPIDFDTNLVLCLTDATRSIRELHKAYLQTGYPPPEGLLLPVIEKTIVAIERISNSK